jgi:hypothetical protein
VWLFLPPLLFLLVVRWASNAPCFGSFPFHSTILTLLPQSAQPVLVKLPSTRTSRPARNNTRRKKFV